MIKTFSRSFRNKVNESDNRWEAVDGVDDLITIIKQLGQDYRELDSHNNWREESSIWGRLAKNSKLIKKDASARKWLYTVWRQDRRSIRTTFFKDKIVTNLPAPLDISLSMNLSAEPKKTFPSKAGRHHVGYIHTAGEYPFCVHFLTEMQIDR
ncbi:unnamed protein product [Didymodactylos carnosus]|uniref:Uncharacterized protein n=1 Tax=Didymodactylos carnosus TaxID=1234261 RepID=A0A8S2DW56_9BILA|nr:unnamed protein product [Didymodactylos carnosus]CAF3761310.1 unnamed protein product [Didymodactylos carnosus]